MHHILRKETLHVLPDPLPVSTCGIDEAGRGPWAGPVVAAAVIFKEVIPAHMRDSKQLSGKSRELLFENIMNAAHVGVGIVESTLIDRIGIKKATNQAMLHALQNMNMTPEMLLIDGRDAFEFPHTFFSIIKGDDLIPHISAASIIAKVTRDRIMEEYHKQYPEYGFNKHKGYGTKAHSSALRLHGPCPIHRLSYKPVARVAQGRFSSE